MTSVFEPIRDDFEQELVAIRAVINAFSDSSTGNPRTRVAAANSATLLLAATFEEFVREMARTYAKAIVAASATEAKLPAELVWRAWQRTLESLARIKPEGRDAIPSDALTRLTTVYEFCRGDITQDIYRDLIHNENNMRPKELNGLFKISGLSNVCKLVSDTQTMTAFLGEPDTESASGILVARLEDFFERRNLVAHSISAMSSSSADQIIKDVDLLSAFGTSLSALLTASAPDQAPVE